MSELVSNFGFNMMAFSFKLRDLFLPREHVLKEVGIKPGFWVLDYGCGPGAYVAGIAELVGESGMVYALDIHPLAIQKVQHVAKKKRLANVKTICSGCDTGLPDNSIDVVLLYDTFHALNDPYAVLAELHRVLKQGGILSFSDHHLNQDEIISGVTNGQLFKLSKKGERTYSFVKQER
jgi:ubiquinone/menaquinone biosynthesis C-methylase UbiE